MNEMIEKVFSCRILGSIVMVGIAAGAVTGIVVGFRLTYAAVTLIGAH
jgi:hypothetical protein